jgi:hypothetical protein
VDFFDRDSFPTALLHHEACMLDLTAGSMDLDDMTEAPRRICNYSMTTKVNSKTQKNYKTEDKSTDKPTDKPTDKLRQSRRKIKT